MRTRSHEEAGKETWAHERNERVVPCVGTGFGILPALPDGTNSIKPDTPEDQHLLSAKTRYCSLATGLTDSRKHHSVPLAPFKTFISISNSCWCFLLVLVTWSWAGGQAELTAALFSNSCLFVSQRQIQCEVSVMSSTSSAAPRQQLILLRRNFSALVWRPWHSWPSCTPESGCLIYWSIDWQKRTEPTPPPPLLVFVSLYHVYIIISIKQVDQQHIIKLCWVFWAE